MPSRIFQKYVTSEGRTSEPPQVMDDDSAPIIAKALGGVSINSDSLSNGSILTNNSLNEVSIESAVSMMLMMRGLRQLIMSLKGLQL